MVYDLFRTLRVTRSRQNRALRDLAEEAEKGRFWLWLGRRPNVEKPRIIRPFAGEQRPPSPHHPERFWDERGKTSVKGGYQLTTLQLAPTGTGRGAPGRNALQVALPVLPSIQIVCD